MVFGKIKQKSVFLSREKKLAKLELIINNVDYSLKQHDTVRYLGCDIMTLILREGQWLSKFPKKINIKLNFLSQ